MAVLELLLLAVGLGFAYWVSLVVHPMRNCRACGGSKEHHDRLWRGARGRCQRCAGTGKRTRWGVMLLRRETHQAIKRGDKGKYY